MVASVVAVALALPASAASDNNGYMTLSGSDYLVSSSFSNGTGDMDFVFYAAADDWSRGTQTVISRWPEAAGDRAVRVQFNAKGHLQFLVKDKRDTTHVYNAFANNLNLRNGNGYWFRVRFNAQVDQTTSVTKFYVSKQAMTTSTGNLRWGEPRSIARTKNITPRDTNGAWVIGAASGGQSDRFKGDIARMGFWRNGWSGNGGKQVISLELRTTKQASNGYRTWSETGRQWTVKGGGWKYTTPTDGAAPTTTKAPTTTTKPPTTTTKPPTTTTTTVAPNNNNYDVTIKPGDNFAAIVANKPAGTSFYVRAGKYRQQQIRPKDGMKFVAQSGTIMSGAKKLTQFTKSGGLWVASGQKQGANRSEGSEWGYCEGSYKACVNPEQLFIDGKLLRQVSSKSQVGPGKWYFDYSNDKIWFADNPTGKTVETSVTSHAFWGDAVNVHIEGFVLEKYATPGRQGTINPRIGRAGAAGKNWTIRNNTIRWNHGYGIKVASGFDIIGNNIHHMGQMGIGGARSSNILIKNNELAYNCISGFQCFGFGGGALKLNGITNITMAGNNVHHNPGHGLHMDEKSTNVVYENNTITNNQGNGIHHEISGNAIVRNNVIRNNGFRADGSKLYGIMILSSSDTEVYGNTLSGNANGILARQDGRTSISKLTNLWVHNNNITLNGQARVGFAISGISDTSYFTSKNNRFAANKYTFKYGSTSFKPFKWIGSSISPTSWKSKGMDKTGTFTWD